MCACLCARAHARFRFLSFVREPFDSDHLCVFFIRKAHWLEPLLICSAIFRRHSAIISPSSISWKHYHLLPHPIPKSLDHFPFTEGAALQFHIGVIDWRLRDYVRRRSVWMWWRCCSCEQSVGHVYSRWDKYYGESLGWISSAKIGLSCVMRDSLSKLMSVCSV